MTIIKVIPITVASVAEWQLEHGSLCFFEIGAVFLRISIKFSQHIVEFRMVLIEFPTSAQHRQRGGGLGTILSFSANESAELYLLL